MQKMYIEHIQVQNQPHYVVWYIELESISWITVGCYQGLLPRVGIMLMNVVTRVGFEFTSIPSSTLKGLDPGSSTL
jgi:hypothetical protein